jgi:hypothetical protein
MAQSRASPQPCPEDRVFQGTMWRVQRIGWAMSALGVVAGLAGAFGDGHLAGARIDAPDLRIHYEQITRAGRQAVIEVESLRAGNISVRLEGPVARALRTVEVPQGHGMSITAEWQRLTLHGSNASAGVVTTLRWTPDEVGFLRGDVIADGGVRRGIWMIVLP